jgi:hypothetical protein
MVEKGSFLPFDQISVKVESLKLVIEMVKDN